MVVTFLALAILGALSVVAGVFMLAGAGWALLAAGAFMLAAAAMIRKGMATHG